MAMLARIWLLRIVFLLALLAVILSLFWALGRMLDGGGAPSRIIQEKTTLLVHRVQAESKLVVATQNLSVSLRRSDCWYLFNRLYLGETVASLRVDDCQVQYYVPGNQVTSRDFRYDPAAKKLTARLPRPILDQALVDIPSNPDCWWVRKSSGWARFDKDAMEAQARRDLRPQVIEMALKSGWDDSLDLVARDNLKKLIRGFLQDPTLEVAVTWR